MHNEGILRTWTRVLDSKDFNWCKIRGSLDLYNPAGGVMSVERDWKREEPGFGVLGRGERFEEEGYGGDSESKVEPESEGVWGN